MRIFLAAIVVIIGVNMGLSMLNSEMMETIKQRNESMERAIDKM
jgi:hypothetical protein